jgi:hypothetical protein
MVYGSTKMDSTHGITLINTKVEKLSGNKAYAKVEMKVY